MPKTYTDTYGRTVTVLHDAADVTDAVLADAESISDGFFTGEKVDWDDFIDRLAGSGTVADAPYGFNDNGTPAIAKIQRHIRTYRNAG